MVFLITLGIFFALNVFDNSYRITKHVDGDTFYVKDKNCKQFKVRLIGVDCPESTIRKDFYGKEASEYIKELLPIGSIVRLEKDKGDKDKYDRLLRYVWLDDDRMVNSLLVEGGYARAKYYKPNGKYKNEFERLEKKARRNKLGMWSEEIEGKYVKSKHSEIYHFPHCVWAMKILNKIWFDDKKNLEGYKPCSICKP